MGSAGRAYVDGSDEIIHPLKSKGFLWDGTGDDVRNSKHKGNLMYSQ